MNRKKSFYITIILGIAILIGIWAYFTFNTPLDQANKDAEVEQKEQTTKSNSTLKELLGTKEDVPTAEQMNNKLGNDYSGEDVEKEYGEGVARLYYAGMIVPNSEVSKLEGSEALRQMKEIMMPDKYVSGYVTNSIVYDEENNYQKSVVPSPLMLSEGQYFVTETGYAEVASNISAGYFYVVSDWNNLGKSAIEGYLIADKDMNVMDFINSIDTFTLNGEELGYLGEFTAYTDKLNEIEDQESRTAMIEETQELGYLGEFSLANQMMAKENAEDLTILAGTVIQIVGVFDELDQETAVVELNGVAYDLAPLEENKEVSLKETDY